MVDAGGGRDATWLGAAEAARALGVKQTTLYAYASRGKVRTQQIGRQKRYLESDLERLRARTRARAGHGAVAAGALLWGEPVLDTRITDLTPDGPAYRGESALALAESSTFEATAELLWTGSDAPPRPWPEERWPVAPNKLAALVGEGAGGIDVMAAALPALAMADPQRLHLEAEATSMVARRLIRLLAAAIALFRGPSAARLALAEPDTVRSIASAFGLRPRASTLSAISTSLILCADHGLNPSSFAARIAASAGADVYACIAAGLATLSGPRHGGMPARVASLFAEIGRPERTARVVGERLRRGDDIPGFGHPLYPGGDPRAGPLIEAARRVSPRGRVTSIVEALVQTMELAGGQPPTLDLGLAAVAAALGLPHGGATALFAVGRSAGWVAQVLEQREAKIVLRPRARYVGPRSA